MGILHKKRSGIPAGDPAGAVGGTNWLDDHDHVPFSCELIIGQNTALTPAAASAAANVELHATAKSCRNKIDLSCATQGRLVVGVIATGNAAGASYKLSYATAEASTWSSGTGVADAGPVCVVGSNGGAAGVIHDSGWTSLAALARIDSCYVTLLVGTAMGTTPPTVGFATLWIR